MQFNVIMQFNVMSRTRSKMPQDNIVNNVVISHNWFKGNNMYINRRHRHNWAPTTGIYSSITLRTIHEHNLSLI